ncbi:MAG TPA: hypothetical protein VHX38_02135 [Pseudonocardiaceae bacterium]|jgi:hypothetical protein|nr:hypothetical protein [Pseudonocardiaceae bacterium]
MPDFVNLGPAVDVYRPAGEADSLHVKAGQTITVPGEITAELDDAYIVGEGDDARSWAKVRWQLKAAPAKSSSRKSDSTSADTSSAAAGSSEGTN